MKCTIAGCPGAYEPRTVVHAVKHRGEVMVIDHVPAEVCNLNDQEQAVGGDIIEALKAYRVTPAVWSQRSQYVAGLAG